MRLSRHWRGRMGQVVMPALFIFPSLMLFVYLIYETAKLSREKIRRQFAIDAAAFVEATNYSDFMNRSAYVNGAFPMRIFHEGFAETRLDCMGKGDCPGPTPLSDILFDNGVFPRAEPKDPNQFASQNPPRWSIRYGGGRGNGMANNPPTIGDPNESGGGPAVVTLLSMDTAKKFNINWDDANQIYKLYVQIYQLLGSVESAQYSVLKRLTTGHNFLKKSYWLNTGGPDALNEAAQAVTKFSQNSALFRADFHCASHARFYANQIVNSWIQPYQIYGTEPPVPLPTTITDCPGGGLFQVVTIPTAVYNPSGTTGSFQRPIGNGYSAGWELETQWTAPNNYFNVNFNNKMERGRPMVHATVAVKGFGSARPSVWPDPTPKFQTRLYP